MGSIGGMLGLGGGAGGTNFSTPSGTNVGQIQTAYNQTQQGMQGQNALLSALQAQNGLGNQTQNYNQLQGVINGTGPNPAQAMLNQQTGQNVANQAALMAGQRGAGSNVGLMARQAAQQGANLQQQAIGQGASLQAQQALNAIGQAGGMANTMAANQIGQQNANVASQQNEQNTLQGANTSNNAVQGQLANTQIGQQGGLLGGAMNAMGAITHLFSDGGSVQKYADGGSAFGPQSMFAQALSAPQQTVPQFGQADSSPLFAQRDKDKPKAAPAPTPKEIAAPAMKGAMNITPQNNTFMGEGPNMMVGAKGGSVGDMLKQGGHVPGKAVVKGDSYKNDQVKALLSPGEVVIPRSVMTSKDPIRGAAEFVRGVMAKKGAKA